MGMQDISGMIDRYLTPPDEPQYLECNNPQCGKEDDEVAKEETEVSEEEDEEEEQEAVNFVGTIDEMVPDADEDGISYSCPQCGGTNFTEI